MQTPDSVSTQEFMDLWLKTYQATYGRLLEMPPMGPFRERYKDMMDNVNVSVNFYFTWMEMISNFQIVFLEGMRRLRIKLDELDDKEEIENLYDEIYKLWIETLSETFHEFLRTEQFSSQMGKFMSLFMDVQQGNQEFVAENLLKPMNVPTRLEMEETNKEIYSLKKEIKRLAMKLEGPTE